jgi:hypothetical protein
MVVFITAVKDLGVLSTAKQQLLKPVSQGPAFCLDSGSILLQDAAGLLPIYAACKPVQTMPGDLLLKVCVCKPCAEVLESLDLDIFIRAQNKLRIFLRSGHHAIAEHHLHVSVDQLGMPSMRTYLRRSVFTQRSGP